MTSPRQSHVGGALVLGLTHALVDASCAFLLFRDLGRSGTTPELVAAWIIAYDVLAFAAQAPLALLLDRRGAHRAAARLGLLLVVLALATGWAAPRLAATLAGLGNALYHIGAGAHVLAASGRRAREIGLFVGPGAVGLAFGIAAGMAEVPLRGALLALLLITAWRALRALPRALVPTLIPRRAKPAAVPLLLAFGLLLLTVVLRAFVGDNIVAGWRAHSATLVLALAVAACAGKMLGGLVADRLGWISTAGGALLLASPALIWASREPALACAGMLLLQTTMPLTLKAVHHVMPDRPALAFGLPSAALLLGSLPGLLQLWPLAGAWRLPIATALSALAVVGGLALLRRSGVSLGREGPYPDPRT